jgi:hypothetical protein
MDQSREADLYYLHKQFHDVSLPMFERQLAYNTYCKIKKQLNDRTLTRLREKFVKASRVNDQEWMWKYRSQINEYMQEERLERFSNND